jgi:RNA polymerase sigma factor for flagellar operon FliA
MLYYEQDLTMREVGELMGVGESGESQIHTLAVKHLRTVM